MRIGECTACQLGDHKRHVRNYDPAPEGMLGGSMCACEGECVARGPNAHIMKTVNLMRRASAIVAKRKTAAHHPPATKKERHERHDRVQVRHAHSRS